MFETDIKTFSSLQFASSPTSLDFDSDIVLVGYTRGFRPLNRKFANSWNIYSRGTKELLHSLERFGDDDLRIGFDRRLYVVTASAVFSVYEYAPAAASASTSASAAEEEEKRRRVS